MCYFRPGRPDNGEQIIKKSAASKEELRRDFYLIRVADAIALCIVPQILKLHQMPGAIGFLMLQFGGDEWFVLTTLD